LKVVVGKGERRERRKWGMGFRETIRQNDRFYAGRMVGRRDILEFSEWT
jgi:hypothetical protein